MLKRMCQEIRFKGLFRLVFLAAMAMLAPSACYADAGVPMIMLEYPLAILALIPVILIECWVFRRQTGLSIRDNIKAVAAANAVSTLVGFPLAWFFRFLVELAVYVPFSLLASKLSQSFLNSPVVNNPVVGSIALLFTNAWLVPLEDDLWWMIPVAGLIGLVPAFFISVRIERKIVARYLDKQIEDVPRTVYRANLASYAFLALISLGFLVHGYATMDPLVARARHDGARLRSYSNQHWLDVITTDKLDLLAKDLATVPKFESITFSTQNLHNTDLSALRRFDRTDSLYLRNAQLDDSDLAKLPILKTVKTLTLYGNGIEGAGLASLSGWSNLESVDIQHNAISDKGIQSISQIKKVAFLDFTMNKIKGTGLGELTKLPNLKGLVLSQNPLTDEGVQNLKHLKSLERLNLGDTPIGDDALLAVKDLVNLSQLHLWRTRVTDKGLSYLTGLKHLQELSINLPGITDEGLKNLSQLTSLEVIDLNGSSVKGPGLKYLYGLKRLRRLWLQGTDVSKADVEALKRELPNAEVFLKK